jgi:hypothetical protein
MIATTINNSINENPDRVVIALRICFSPLI